MTKVAVRDGRLVVPTCPSCGCRLQKHSTLDAFLHYWGNYPRDARGCLCKYLNVFWFRVDDRYLGSHTNSNSLYHNVPMW